MFARIKKEETSVRTTNDFIKVVNMPVFAYHGVLSEEKEDGQDFFLNAKVYVDMRKAGMTDHLEDTINYDQICVYLKEVFAENCFDTIEYAVFHAEYEKTNYEAFKQEMKRFL